MIERMGRKKEGKREKIFLSMDFRFSKLRLWGEDSPIPLLVAVLSKKRFLDFRSFFVFLGVSRLV